MPQFGCVLDSETRKRPDFTGEWVLDRQASSLSPGADAMQSAVVRIEHREPTFRYEAAFAAESGQVDVKYELQTDGREIVATLEGITTVSRLRWDDDTLVATWRIQLPDSEMTIS